MPSSSVNRESARKCRVIDTGSAHVPSACSPFLLDGVELSFYTAGMIRLYTFSITGNCNLVAEFKTTGGGGGGTDPTPPTPTQYTVTVSAGTGGSATGGGTYNKDTSVTVKAIPQTGYHFVKWTENGTQISTLAEYNFTVTASRNLVAVFEVDSTTPTEYKVTFDANGGSVNPTEATTAGGKLASLPTASRSGYHFDGWFTTANGGAKITTDTVYASDTRIYAHWTKNSGSGDSGSGGDSGNGGGNHTGSNNDDNNQPGTNPTETPTQPSTTPIQPAASDNGTNKLDDVPKTGDTANPYSWFLLALLSGIGAVYFGRKKKTVK